MKVRKVQWFKVSAGLMLLALLSIAGNSSGFTYVIPDTDQILCYDAVDSISPPSEGESFYGQDAQYSTNEPDYISNSDGTVTDLNTGLMWQQGVDDKMSWDEAVAGAYTCTIGGYTDWRLPTIKELYSLIHFSGTDPSGPSPANLIPFIDTEYFAFEYGDTLSGERLIDAQYWSSTQYMGLTMIGDSTTFGVNFADGRIKGYPNEEVGPPGRKFLMTSFVRYVRGNDYGTNQFVDNGNGTVTDLATGLMWQQSDDGTGRTWQEALEYAENLDLAGESDWKLPDAHELQSIVDYTRSLQETNSPAIDPIFNCTQITDEGGGLNYGFYWTGTTHANANSSNSGTNAAYIAFGEALGWMMAPDSTYTLMDVHGAGAQRSDPKFGDPSQYPHGFGPQGDVIRIYNLVRSVRNADLTGIEEADIQRPSLSLTGSNPFNGTVNLACTIPSPGSFNLSIYNSAGRLVKVFTNTNITTKTYLFNWSPGETGLSAGVYLCRLNSEYGHCVLKTVYSGL